MKDDEKLLAIRRGLAIAGKYGFYHDSESAQVILEQIEKDFRLVKRKVQGLGSLGIPEEEQ